MNIKEVVKNTLLTLQKEGTSPTPDEYKRVFCAEAKRAKLALPECNEIEKYLSKLDEKLRKQLQNYPIRSLDDLILFLISAAHRERSSDNHTLLNPLLQLLKRVLSVVAQLHNKEATALANETLNKIDLLNDAANIDRVKERWSEFSSRYKDEFLDEWAHFLKVNRSDFKSFSDEVLKFVKNTSIKGALPNIIEAIAVTFEPSINKGAKAELQLEIKELMGNPMLLIDGAVVQRIKKGVKKRIELDKYAVEEKTAEITKIIDLVTQKLGRISNKNSQIQVELTRIKDKIAHIGRAEISVDELKAQLNDITDTLDSEIEGLNYEIYSKQKEIDNLKERILNLEVELESAKSEAMTDALTKVGTKKVLLEELERFDHLYQRHQTNFSVIFFDIDFFKKINDTYGHDAGDKVLSSFGALIKKHARKEDVIARYGGEEFVALLPETTLKGAITFANNVREAVQNSKFLYKKETILITLSAGVCERAQVGSKEDVMQKADEELYRAKKSGRNRIYPIVD